MNETDGSPAQHNKENEPWINMLDSRFVFHLGLNIFVPASFYDVLPLKGLETFVFSAFKIQGCSLKTPSKPVL